jgi:hypothetical protein
MLYHMSQKTKDRAAAVALAVSAGRFVMEIIQQSSGSGAVLIPAAWLYALTGAAVLSLCILALWAFDRCKTWILGVVQRASDGAMEAVKAEARARTTEAEAIRGDLQREKSSRAEEQHVLGEFIGVLRHDLEQRCPFPSKTGPPGSPQTQHESSTHN